MTTKQLIRAYNKTGRIAWYFPRLKRISLNGGQSMPEKEGAKRIREFLNTSNSTGLK